MVSMHTSPADAPGRGDAGGMNVMILGLAQALARRGVDDLEFLLDPEREQPRGFLRGEG